MTSETKICQNCKNQFTIEPDDFRFYEKVKVPPPTFCPDCRLQRRLLWRNQWHFFKKEEARTRKPIFSFFPPESPVKIYERDFWWSDGWDPMEYGREYDWSRPFFAQLKELLHAVPLPSRSANDLVNSDYSNNAGWLKNCYLVFDANYCEDSGYLVDATYSKHCFDCLSVNKCELCYESFNLDRCYRTFYSVSCESSHDIWFCRDCAGCSFCFGCANLHNKSYCIFNTQYSKEEYSQKIKEYATDSHPTVQRLLGDSHDFWEKFPYRYVSSKHNSHCTGEYIFYSKNTEKSYRVVGGEDLKYCHFLQEGTNKECRDYSIWGHNTELVYETAVCGQWINSLKFCWLSYSQSRNLEYCIACHNSSDLFGCIGLRNKKFCIFNKQYSEEEYKKLTPKIIEHLNTMPFVDKKGSAYRYGEFFPPELSPFAYNDTVAQEHFPLTKEEAVKKGYLWRDPERKRYKITVTSEQLPLSIKEMDDRIVRKTIGCLHKNRCEEGCTGAFVITPQELAFYKAMQLSLPRLCPNCREWQRIYLRNPYRLFLRRCACAGTRSEDSTYSNAAQHFHGSRHCPNEFETPYAPDRPEIVYCEQCYQTEVV